MAIFGNRTLNEGSALSVIAFYLWEKILEKYEIIEMAREYVCPGKIDTFGQVGIDLVIGKRQGPYIFDTDGKRFIDLHINGGVFNLGHRHPELIKTLMSAFEETGYRKSPFCQ